MAGADLGIWIFLQLTVDVLKGADPKIQLALFQFMKADCPAGRLSLIYSSQVKHRGFL